MTRYIIQSGSGFYKSLVDDMPLMESDPVCAARLTPGEAINVCAWLDDHGYEAHLVLLRQGKFIRSSSQIIQDMQDKGFTMWAKSQIGSAPDSGLYGRLYYGVAFIKYASNYAVNQAEYADTFDEAVQKAQATALDLEERMKNN